MKKDNTLIKSFYNFLEDTEGAEEDIASALKEHGIDVSDLKMKVADVVKKGSEKRRMAWRESAKKERSRIEMLLTLCFEVSWYRRDILVSFFIVIKK